MKQAFANCEAIGVALLTDGLPSLDSLEAHLLIGGSI